MDVELQKIVKCRVPPSSLPILIAVINMELKLQTRKKQKETALFCVLISGAASQLHQLIASAKRI